MTSGRDPSARCKPQAVVVMKFAIIVWWRSLLVQCLVQQDIIMMGAGFL